MPPIRTRSPARVAAQGVARAHALSAAAAALSLADRDDFAGVTSVIVPDPTAMKVQAAATAAGVVALQP
jgi:hypothetical protein